MAGITETDSAVIPAEVDRTDHPEVTLPEESIDEVKDQVPSTQEESASDEESVPHPETPGSDNENGREALPSRKRERKKVQRLSETWSQAHVEQIEQKAKVAKELISVLETGSGTPLGDIPIIEAAFRKSKPVNLKGLHSIIYGRPGAATEIRSNLRKFRGFGFTSGSEAYNKKVNHIQNRSTSELREALRVLSLEVSGTREQLIQRLLEFLLFPTANMVKYKGKLPPKSRGRSKSHSDGKGKRKPKTGSKKATSSEVSGDATSRSGADYEDDQDSVSGANDSSSSEHVSDEDNSESEAPKKPAKKRGRPPSKPAPPAPTPKRKRASAAAALTDSDSEGEDHKKSAPKPGAPSATAAESDEDMPLSALAPPKPNTAPTDSELKRKIIELLKTVNLEETSLKLVREQIFSRYPGVDLTNKKEFINTTVKEYLARS